MTEQVQPVNPDEDSAKSSNISRAGLDDGRSPGDFKSRYPGEAWFHIVIELLYLLTVLGCAVSLLIIVGNAYLSATRTGLNIVSICGFNLDVALLYWMAVALGGCCGGCMMSLKWLYHAVGKQSWHRDRTIWRLTVPILSGLLAAFSILLIRSNILPILNGTSISNIGAGVGFGFFLGLFSDNLLGSLQNFAYSIFGTVDKRPSGDKHP